MRHMLVLIGVLVSALCPAHAEDKAAEPPAASQTIEPKPTWNREASIKGAAERLGRLHRARGAKAAYEFIENCYKTHSLASTYGEGFESCIAQDYLETNLLAQVYARLPPEALEQLGIPTPAMLADAMGRRITAAFSQYKVPVSYIKEFKALVDAHGMPVFLAIVIPAALKSAPQPNGRDKNRNER